jgi:hypothetical protein
MTPDPAPPSADKPDNPEDDARTEQAKRVVAEYVSELREILRKLRKLFN